MALYSLAPGSVSSSANTSTLGIFIEFLLGIGRGFVLCCAVGEPRIESTGVFREIGPPWLGQDQDLLRRRSVWAEAVR